MYHNISDKLLFRVSTMYGGYLVACDVATADEDLALFCAKLSTRGAIINSVVRIFENSKDTPRVSVLTTKEYKNALAAELERSKHDGLEAGDIVETPRFGEVKLDEVFENHEMLHRAGYTWSTGYEGNCEIAGKPNGKSGMRFAAAKKAPYKKHVFSMSITAKTNIRRPFIDYIRLVDADGNEYDIGWELSEQTTKDGVYRATFTNLVSLRNEIRDLDSFDDMHIDTVSVYNEDKPSWSSIALENGTFAITSMTISDETGATYQMKTRNGFVPVDHYYHAD